MVLAENIRSGGRSCSIMESQPLAMMRQSVERLKNVIHRPVLFADVIGGQDRKADESDQDDSADKTPCTA